MRFSKEGWQSLLKHKQRMGFAAREDVVELALREMLRIDLAAEPVQHLLDELENSRNRTGASPTGLLLTKDGLALIERYRQRLDALKQQQWSVRNSNDATTKTKRVVVVELPGGPEANPELF
jgi:hypothetical protein